MGKINQGILGGFSGKVGNVVGGKWKGIDWMRVRVIPANPKTASQITVRSLLKDVVERARFAKVDVVNVGFEKKVKGKALTQSNAFVSANILDQTWLADFSLVHWSDGILAQYPISNAEYYSDTNLMYATCDDSISGYGSTSDPIVIFAGSDLETNISMFSTKEEGLARTPIKDLLSTAGTGMYRILSGPKMGNLFLFAFATNSLGEVSNTIGTPVVVGAVDPYNPV